MVKIAAKDCDQFIAKIPQDVKAILLYGPDYGLSKVRADIVAKSYSLSDRFKYEQANSNALLDSLRAIKLFDERLEKFSIIECSGASLTEPLLSIVKNHQYPGLLVFIAGELGTDSSLRKHFENLPHTAAVPAYADDRIGVAKIITQLLKEHQITCENGLVQMLSSSMPLGDRALIVNEVEKILLFLSGKQHILNSDLEQYLQTQAEVNFDVLCYQASLKRSDKIEQQLISLQTEGHSLVSIIRMLIRHFTRLYQVKSLIELGNSQQQALDSLSPPVFFKQINDFTASLKLWSADELLNALEKLNQLELNSKQTAIPAGLMLRKFLMQ